MTAKLDLLKLTLTLIAPLFFASGASAQEAVHMKHPPRLEKSEQLRPERYQAIKARAVTPQEYDSAVKEAALLYDSSLADWQRLEQLLAKSGIRKEVARTATDMIPVTTHTVTDSRGIRYEIWLPLSWKDGKGMASWWQYDDRGSWHRSTDFDLATSRPHNLQVEQPDSRIEVYYSTHDGQPLYILKRLGGSNSIHISWRADGTVEEIWYAEEPLPTRIELAPPG